MSILRKGMFPILVIVFSLICFVALDRIVSFFLADELNNPIPLIRGKEFEQTCAALANGEETLGLACSPYFQEFPPVDYFQEENRDPGSLFIYHPDYFWHLRPKASIDCNVPYVDKKLRELMEYRIQTNSRGFRGPEFLSKKADNVFRIVTIGDSRTFGWGVQYEQAYPGRVRHYLETINDSPLEVINAGIPGYSSYQVLQLVELEIQNWSPDLVICWFGCNDSWPCRETDEQLSQEGVKRSFLHRILRKSALYHVLRQVYFISFESRRSSWKEGLNTRRVPPASFIRNCLLISKIFSSKDVPVIFISLGEGKQYHQALKKCTNLSSSRLIEGEVLFLEAQRKMRQGIMYQEDYTRLSGHLGVTLLNRYPSLDLFVDPAHPNSIGHDLLARELVRMIRVIWNKSDSVNQSR